MAKVWIKHSDRRASSFTVGVDRLLNLAAICDRFFLDLKADLSLCGAPVRVINGMSDRTLDEILEEASEGGDGTTRSSALIIEEQFCVVFRHYDENGAMHTTSLFLDGFFHLQRLCDAFKLDPSSLVCVAGVALEFTDAGKSRVTIRTVREQVKRHGVAEDGLSKATAFTVKGSPSQPPKKELTTILSRGGVINVNVPSKFKAICTVPSPSFEAGSLERIRRCYNRKLFKDMRAEQGLPIALGARAFGIFSDCFDSEQQFVQPRLLDAAKALRDQMHKVYQTEELRRLAFVDILRGFLESDDIYKVVDVHDKIGKRSRDGSYIKKSPHVQVRASILGRTVVLLTIVVRPEMGFNGDPLLESLYYYADDAAESFSSSRHYGTACPELIGELVGPNIRLGGVIYHDKPIYQPLTDFVSLLPFEDDTHLFKLMRLIASMQRGLDELRRMYHLAFSPASPPVRESRLHWPYALREKYPDAVDAHQIQDKLVYLVTTSLGQRRVVKFGREYGEEAHKQWEEAGYAPKHTIHELPGKWKMVDMECLRLADGWQTLLELHETSVKGMVVGSTGWDKMQAAGLVWQALMKLQALQPVMVHGDLRLNNIMYNVRTGQVCFIDFDWAGREETVRYPLLLSTRVDWPDGVKPNKLIKAVHDRQLLKQELGIVA